MYFLNRFFVAFFAMLVIAMPLHVSADTAAEIDSDVDASLKLMYASTPLAKELEKEAKGILIFPDVLKAGLIIGGQYGKGALRINGKTAGYFNTIAASYGLQAGAQTFGYALFFMTDETLEYLNESAGWEIGVGPTIVVVDSDTASFASSFTTTSGKDNVYAIFFNQKGLMGGLGIQGSKVSRITPDK